MAANGRGRPKKFDENLVRRYFELPESLSEKVDNACRPQDGYPRGRNVVDVAREAFEMYLGTEGDFARPTTAAEVRQIVREEVSQIVREELAAFKQRPGRLNRHQEETDGTIWGQLDGEMRPELVANADKEGAREVATPAPPRGKRAPLTKEEARQSAEALNDPAQAEQLLSPEILAHSRKSPRAHNTEDTQPNTAPSLAPVAKPKSKAR